MLNLFKAEVLVEVGLNCDCCVVTIRTEADVYAKDESHAKELLQKHNPIAKIEIQSLENKGVVEEKIENPGIIVSKSTEVYRGDYRKSPLYGK